MFIGREKELFQMNRLYQQESFQMLVVYGRRRVGKTTLLKEFCKDKPTIFYSASQQNETQNLLRFSEQIFSFYQEDFISPFSDFEKAFQYIGQRQQNEQLVLVLDEFPYLAECNPALISIMQHLIDHQLQNTKLYLILCGSYMGFMEKEVLSAKSPLFGRRTGQLRIKPFDYLTSSQFLNGFSKEEQLMLYGAFGGTPMYLQRIQQNQTLEENIINLILSPVGYLYEETLLLLRQELQQPTIYSTIIEAIASGATKLNEIAVKTGEDSAKCLKYINILCELGITYKETPFSEKEKSRKTLYQISDMMFRFWYRYVSPNRTLLETGAEQIVWKNKVLLDFSTYMGYVFEKVCRDYLLHQNSKGKLPILFTEIGRWWGTDKKNKSQVEIDIIARDKNSYLFGECKWRNDLLDMAVVNSLKEKAKVFGHQQDDAYYIFFSKSGFTQAVLDEAQKNNHLILINLENLFS